MKLVIFGATGRTGQYLLKNALTQGHHVSVFVRDPQKLAVPLPKEQIHRGDVQDSDAIEQAIHGNEAVFFVIGSGGLGPTTLRQDAIRSIIAAMQKQQVRRIVALSTAMVGNAGFVATRILRPLIFRNTVGDSQAMEVLIRASSLDFTIVRAPRLRQKEMDHPYKEVLGDEARPLSISVSRASVAHIMLKSLQNPGYVRQIVTISD